MRKSTIEEVILSSEFSLSDLFFLIVAAITSVFVEVLETEATNFITNHQHIVDEKGHQQIVKNGYHKERTILTLYGPIKIQVPRIRDIREFGEDVKNKIKFASKIIPAYVRRCKFSDQNIVLLYLKGISTGDFSEIFESLCGDIKVALSASTISRITNIFIEEYKNWCNRNIDGKRYSCIFCDGVYFPVKGQKDNLCCLVVIGVNEYGIKEVIAVQPVPSESSTAWKKLFKDLKRRGMKGEPLIAVGDSGQGLWNAISKVFPSTKHQHCLVHLRRNVDKCFLIETDEQKKIKSMAMKQFDIMYNAKSRKEAEEALEKFIKKFKKICPEAVECLTRNRKFLFSYFDFPKEIWKTLISSNPIESTFSPLKERMDKTRGMLSKEKTCGMAFKLLEMASKKWKKVPGMEKLKLLIQGCKFVDGELVDGSLL
jgi:transposase-like protein